jgi:hypothetical protein
MQTVLITIVLLVLAMLALGIGLVFGRTPLKRSCGGEACLSACAGCDRHGRRPMP